MIMLFLQLLSPGCLTAYSIIKSYLLTTPYIVMNMAQWAGEVFAVQEHITSKVLPSPTNIEVHTYS